MEENKTTEEIKEEVINDPNNKPQFAIFDKIVSLPVIRIVKPLYEWKKAFWIYCFCGFMSTVSNYLFTIIFVNGLHMYGAVGNAFAWVLSTVVSFCLYRYCYFDRTNNTFINELLKFASGRVVTFGIEEIGVLVLVDLMGMDIRIIKIILIPVTALVNFLISKFFVFRNK